MAQVLDEPLKNAETLYVREGWLGEARAVRELHKWFDNLDAELEKEIRELES